MQEDKNKQARQLDNLTNLVENHTRTERHLEQYSEIGSKENKDHARHIQNIREQEMQDLKQGILGQNQNASKQEQVDNIVENYNSTARYMENNYNNISEQDRENLEKKQENRKTQAKNLEENINNEQ